MYFSQLLCYIERCHRAVGLPFEDGAVFNMSLISWRWESSTRSLCDFMTHLCPPLLIVLFLRVKRALDGPKILFYGNLVDNASKLSSYGLDRCRNRSIMRQGEKYNILFQQIHIDPGNAVVLDYVQIYICGRFRELFRILGNSDL